MTDPPLTALTALYVPGDRPDRFDQAAVSGTDVVILDLEDSVAPAAKDQAREHVVGWLVDGVLPAGVAVQVRLNPSAGPWGADDLAALPAAVDVRIPKVEGPDDVEAAIAGSGRAVHAVIESAAGVEAAGEVARHPAVRTVALGEADLRADLGGVDERGLDWCRSRLVVAARAARLPAPMMSVHPHVCDLDGLAESCRAGRALGLRGRTAIHPRQLPVIRAAFAPTGAEQQWAEEVLAALHTTDTGVAVLSSGEMVDEAVARRARAIRALGS